MKFDIQDHSLGFLDTESQCFPYKKSPNANINFDQILLLPNCYLSLNSHIYRYTVYLPSY